MIIRRPARILVELAIAVVLLCGLFFVAWYLRGGTRISEPDQLRDKLTASGLGCKDYQPTTLLEEFRPGTYRGDRCGVMDEDTLIVVLPDEDYVFPLEAGAIDRGCTRTNTLAFTRLAFVVGDGWVIQPKTAETARAIQAALGGRVEALTCAQ